MRIGLLSALALAAACVLAADVAPRPIVFTALRDGAECIRTVQPEGGAPQAVTDGGANAFMAELNRQGTLVAYCRDVPEPGGTQIFVARPDGTGARMVTATGNNYHPSFSPDGMRLVYHTTRHADREIYTIALDGTDERRITNNTAEDREPVFGPDGHIYFQSNRDGNWEVYRMDADGANPTRLTNSPEEEREPAVSPDGTMIAFARRTAPFEIGDEGDVVEVHVMAADGTDLRRVTPEGEHASHPSFSPDSRRLVYQAGPLYHGSIRSINLDGTGGADVGPTNSYSPTWGK